MLIFKTLWNESFVSPWIQGCKLCGTCRNLVTAHIWAVSNMDAFCFVFSSQDAKTCCCMFSYLVRVWFSDEKRMQVLNGILQAWHLVLLSADSTFRLWLRHTHPPPPPYPPHTPKFLTLNSPMSVVKILIFKIHSYNDWQENGWILFWHSKLDEFLIADKGWKANFLQIEFKWSTVSCAHLTAPTCTAGVV